MSYGANAFQWACHDANASCRDVMMQCPLSACHDANVHLWARHDANVYVGMS